MAGKEIILSIIRGVNILFPKKKGKVLLYGFPDYSDNSRALYEYLMQTPEYSYMSFYWVVETPEIMPSRERTSYIKYPHSFREKEYVIYLYHVFTSQLLFTTHQYFLEANRKAQICVSLWHGTMLKTICAMNPREKKAFKPKKQFSFYTCSSNYYVDLFDKSFLCGREHIKVTGYPRNDMLFEETNVLERLALNINPRGKIVVYMPTFKTPKTGDFHDTNCDVNENVLNFSSRSALEELEAFLSKVGVTLLIKWHPLDVHQTSIEGYPHVLSINNNDLQREYLQLYHVLHYADALITDFSSVYCDFMLLDRPMAFDVSDIKSYNDKRGFVFEKPLDVMPGYLIRNKNDLFDFVTDVANGIDKSRERRHSLNYIYNDYLDNQSSKRVINEALKKR